MLHQMSALPRKGLVAASTKRVAAGPFIERTDGRILDV
jgi:hypothetical protein